MYKDAGSQRLDHQQPVTGVLEVCAPDHGPAIPPRMAETLIQPSRPRVLLGDDQADLSRTMIPTQVLGQVHQGPAMPASLEPRRTGFTSIQHTLPRQMPFRRSETAVLNRFRISEFSHKALARLALRA